MHSAKAGASGPPPPDPANSLHTMPTAAPVALGPSLPTVPGGAPPGVAALPGTSTPMASAMPWTAPSVPSTPVAPTPVATLSAAHPGRNTCQAGSTESPTSCCDCDHDYGLYCDAELDDHHHFPASSVDSFAPAATKRYGTVSAACVESFFRSREKIDQGGEGVLLDTGGLVCSRHCPSAYPCAEAVPMVLLLEPLRAGSRLFTRSHYGLYLVT